MLHLNFPRNFLRKIWQFRSNLDKRLLKLISHDLMWGIFFFVFFFVFLGAFMLVHNK